jgi:hypothetical protein
MKYLMAAIALVFGVVNISVANEKAPRSVVLKRDVTPKMNYKLIRLQSLDFRTIDAVCRQWITKGGKLIHDKKLNAVLVYDTPQVVEKIQRFVAQNDSPPVNIRIDIESMGVQPTRDTNFGYRTPKRHSKGHFVYKDGKLVYKAPKKIIINASDRRGTSSRLNSSFLVTKSGSPASLWSGKTMIDPSWLRWQKGRPDIYVVDNKGMVVHIEGSLNDPKWANVGTALYILPRYLGNGLVEVEIYPTVTYLVGKGRKKTVKVENLSTKLVVKEGQRIPIGGVVSSKSKRYSNLFGPTFLKSREMSDVLNTYLKATVLKPGDSMRQYKNWIPR